MDFKDWALVLGATIFEICGTISMKLSDGFNHLIPSVMIFVFYALSFSCLTFALKRLELGTVYAIWAGLGTALVAIIGFVIFEDKINFIKIMSIIFIIIGVIGLNTQDMR